MNVDPLLWHVSAGGIIEMPMSSSKVAYFPQGPEHTLTDVDFNRMPRVPAFVLCRVLDAKLMADLETNEVYAKIKLSPLGNGSNDYDFDDEMN